MQEQATAKAMNAVFTSRVPKERYFDYDGFLHITLRVMRTGLLKYAQTEETFPDGVPPDAVGLDGMITVLVEPEELSDPDSLASLEGKDILRKHVWATPDQPRDAVGSIAGVARFDGEFVVCDAVIKDADAIHKLQSGEWIEDSAGYQHVIEWDSQPYVAKAYAGKQKTLRFNHVVLLPEGQGRAGPTVRAINTKEKQLSEQKEDGGILVWLKSLGGKPVRVMNADDAEKVAEVDAKAENEESDSGGKPPPTADLPTPEDIAQMRDTITALTAQKDELESQLAELRSALDGGAPEEAVDEAIEEREEFVEVMNSSGVMDRAQAMNAIKENKLRGARLKAYAMNSIRKTKGLAELTPEQTENTVAVNARWDEFKAGLAAVPVKTNVVGALPFSKAINSREDARESALKAIHGFRYKEKGNK